MARSGEGSRRKVDVVRSRTCRFSFFAFLMLCVEIREEYGDNEAMQLTCYATERLIEFDYLHL